MTFIRTPSGIGNRHLFSGSIFTVYLEEDPEKDPIKGIDQGFWREFFGKYFAELRIRFVPMGGKPHVENMARKIISSSVPNSLCAMDTDYDELVRRKIDDERVFYTFGYGVENDIFAPFNFSGLLRALLPGLDHHDDKAVEVIELLSETIRRGKYCLISDQVARCYEESTLDRKKPVSNLVAAGSGLPVKICRKRIISRLSEIRRKNKCKKINIEINITEKNIPAHHYFEIVYLTICRYIRRYTGAKIPKDMFITLGLGLIQNNFDFEAAYFNGHYAMQGARELGKYIS